jgi:hypothetical protein
MHRRPRRAARCPPPTSGVVRHAVGRTSREPDAKPKARPAPSSTISAKRQTDFPWNLRARPASRWPSAAPTTLGGGLGRDARPRRSTSRWL